MLPSGAQSHFFLSHCQATGGDQCNAIYLELRQLGFACWYSSSSLRSMISFCCHFPLMYLFISYTGTIIGRRI
jgi:hypothetical protein